MLRDILVHVDSSQAGRMRVRFAAELANRMGARLTGIHVTPPVDVPPLYKPSRIAEVEAHLEADLVIDAEGSAIVFREAAMAKLGDTAWLAIEGDVVEGITSEARYADLVIVGQYEWQGSAETHPLPVAHSLVIQCGRPVLVVPATDSLRPMTNVIVAWDGSREAVRAIHDALPLLQRARTTTLLTMRTSATDYNQTEIAKMIAHLARQDIKAEFDEQVVPGSEHQLLQQRIDQGNYDLLVMGGYSHRRWVEFLFGGATQAILLASRIPVLVSH